MPDHTNIYIAKQQPVSICQLCGKKAELRPYGPNGESICFQCGMKDAETTERMFATKALGMTEAEFNELSERIKYQNN